jgi:hypothetical protein
MDDSYTLVYKHTVKAEAIDAKDFRNDQKNIFCNSFLYKRKCCKPYAIPHYRYNKLFLRGSLYFEVTPNSDSLAPAIEYIEQDIVRLVESFEWKKSKCNVVFEIKETEIQKLVCGKILKPLNNCSRLLEMKFQYRFFKDF